MGRLERKFSPRQYMKSGSDFELFHNRDEPPLEIEFHHHDFYEIYYFISGKVTYIVEGKSYNLKPGDIFLINNKEMHKPVMEYGSVYERIVIWVNPDFIKRNSTENTNLSNCFDSTLKSKQNLLRPSPNIQSMIKSTISRLEQVCMESPEDSFGNDILGNIYVVELLTYLNIAHFDSYKESVQGDIVFDRKVSDIIHYIGSNLGKDLSLEALSKKFYISKYHLLREFKKYTGYTPYEYALHKRLIHSREQLKDGNRIFDIYHSCGFGDYSNFYRSFKKVYGMTPKEFQQSMRAGKS